LEWGECLEKATDLGDRLAKAFGEMNGIPRGQINLQTGRSSSPAWLNNKIILADAAALAVEFRQLSKRTKNEINMQKRQSTFPYSEGYGTCEWFVSLLFKVVS